MTVRQRMDQLFNGAEINDLDFTADQRSVAALVFALKLLADSIDEIANRPPGAGGPSETEKPVGIDSGLQDLISNVADMTEQIGELKEQLRKLSKILKKLAKNT
jgi:hypothetical protein